MAKAESPFLYRRVLSVSVPGFIIDKLGDDTVEAAQTPFKEGYISDFSRLVTKNRGPKRINSGLVQISPSQKRAFELRHGEKGNVFWADEYGNPYGVLQEKGGNVTNPDVRLEPRAPSGFLIWGIQDSDSILRTVRASNLLRIVGISTEAIVRLTEPEELRFKGRGVTREEFKQKLVQKVWDANHRKNVHLEDGWSAVTRAEVPKLASELKAMTFYLSILGRQVSERFHDLKYVSSASQLQRIMERVFTFWNLKQEFIDKSEDGTKILDSNKPEDIYKFFTTYLPDETAGNYAGLHNLWLVHTFPHLGNVSLVGSIYDLDSVYGKPLGIGDEKVTDAEIIDELVCLMNGKEGWQQADGILNLLDKLEQNNFYVKGVDFDGVREKFAKAFALRYIEDRGWLGNLDPNLKNIEALLRICRIHLAADRDKDVLTYLTERIGEDNKALLYSRYAFIDYPFPVMFDIDNRPFSFPDQASAVELSKATETIAITKQLLQEHQINLLRLPANIPAKKEDFFSFPKITEYMIQLHGELSRVNIMNILRLHLDGELDTLAAGYQPRTLGSFMLTLAQLNTKHLAEAAMSNIPSIDDPQFIEKLKRINEFLELLPPRSTHRKTEQVWDYIANIARETGYKHGDGFYLDREINYRSAISLFGRGIITPHLHEMFNHSLSDIIMNEFTKKEAEALRQAIECPDLVDKLMGQEHTTYFLRLALTGVQVRSGSAENLALMFYNEDDIKQRVSADLQYFFASQDKDQITDNKLRRVLAADVDKKRALGEGSWTVANLEHLIKARRPLHPNSFLASRLRGTHLWADDLVGILKTALDLNNGDLSQMDTKLREILAGKEYGHMLTSNKVAGLVTSCIGFGIDIPEMLDVSFAEGLNQYVFMDFLSGDKLRREGGIYRILDSYPVSPIYRLMSQGVSALPERVRGMFERAGDNQNVVNTLAEGILNSLFTYDYSYQGYFRCFFGGILNSEGYPQTNLTFDDFGKFRSNDRVGWQLWRIVHPDIWDIVSLADDQVLFDYVTKKLSDTVRMDHAPPKSKMVGYRDTHLSECLPPYLYRKIAHLVKSGGQANI